MIVSDSTALITLINVDEFRLLEMFAPSIIIAEEVYDEISKRASAQRYIDSKIKEGFVSVEHYSDSQLFDQICYILDRGESASITLAIERNLPLIIDEKRDAPLPANKGWK